MTVRFTCGAQDCLSAIAELHGHFPQTIWDHPDNAALRAARGDGNVLRPGDVVTIPDITPADRPAETGKRHRFRLRGVPEVFRLRLLDRQGAPRAGLDWILDAGGRRHAGSTDAHGRLQVFVPAGVRHGVLEVFDRGEVERRRIAFSALRPEDGADGVLQRLVNLGFVAPGETDPAARVAALRRFQEKQGLQVTGRPDDATMARIEQVYRGEA